MNRLSHYLETFSIQQHQSNRDLYASGLENVKI